VKAQHLEGQYFDDLCVKISLFIAHFPLYFRDVLMTLYKPVDKIVDEVVRFKNRYLRKPYISVHARGFYDPGESTNLLFSCANQLLASGNVTYLFFATESRSLFELAKKTIKSKQLIYVQKQLVDDRHGNIDTFEIRQKVPQMHQAIVEWMLVGSADYCMTPTIDLSTFSQTAILSGPCKYVPFLKRKLEHKGKAYDCVHLENNHRAEALILTEKQKELLIAYGRNSADMYAIRDFFNATLNLTHGISNNIREHLWQSIRHAPTAAILQHYGDDPQDYLLVAEQCVTKGEESSVVRGYYFP
jgi:glutaredoxin